MPLIDETSGRSLLPRLVEERARLAALQGGNPRQLTLATASSGLAASESHRFEQLPCPTGISGEANRDKRAIRVLPLELLELVNTASNRAAVDRPHGHELLIPDFERALGDDVTLGRRLRQADRGPEGDTGTAFTRSGRQSLARTCDTLRRR